MVKTRPANSENFVFPVKCHHIVRDVDEQNAPATNKFDTHLDIEEAKREKGALAMDDKRRIQIHDQAYLSYDETVATWNMQKETHLQ